MAIVAVALAWCVDTFADHSTSYFSKELKDLNVREAALLAGIPQATDTYSPVRNPKAAKGRRNEVLSKMAELGMISPEQARKAASKGLGVTTSQYFTKRREH